MSGSTQVKLMAAVKRQVNVLGSGEVTPGLGYAALLAGICVLILGAQRYFFGTLDPIFSIASLFLFLAAVLIAFKLGVRAEWDSTGSFIRKENYRRALLQSSKDIVSLADRQTLSEKVVRTLTQIFNVNSVTFFLLDEVKTVYQLRVSIGWDKDFKHISLPMDDPLIHRISREPRILTEDDLEVFPIEENKAVLLREMQLLSAKIVVPLMLRGRLVGLFSLGSKVGGGNFNQGDLELLSILGNQASVALENARLYENLKNSQSIIRRADRLSSLGMLTAGLAHEIRNPLVAIRTFTQLLPERYQDREFREEFQAIALREVDRICGLVNDLLSFARPSTPNVSLENINDIVDSIARILETEAKERGIQVDRRLTAKLPRIFIDQEQIKQVCMNVILNAIQSIEGDGMVEVSSRLFSKNGSEEFVQIGVRDTGVGIPEKDLENIFNPFFTTKKEGSGLGLSISHQIVQEHGGYIVVESEIGKGTTFFINLPVKHINQTGVSSHPQVVHEEDFSS